jgi:hypothetical protein
VPARPIRFLFLLSILAPVLAAASREGAGLTAKRADLSGTWVLDEGRTTRKGESSDAPLEALVDARRLVIVEDGRSVRIAYPAGRVREFRPDGEERQLDDGDGPAEVKATRTGGALVVSSKWRRGRVLQERWELQPEPRRLLVTGKADGQFVYRYQRVYEPAPPGKPEQVCATPAATPASSPRYATTPTPAPAATAEAPAPVPAAASGVKPECSIRPPKGTPGAELAAMAKITGTVAGERAGASVAPKKVSSVISSDVEVRDGCLVWPLALRLEGGGILEVAIDAGDGKVISSGPPED